MLTSQCDRHLWWLYLCMGTSNSISLQESWHLPPSSLSVARQIFSSIARVTILLPDFLLSSPSLSFEFSTSLTFNHRDYEKKGILELNCHSDIAPGRQAFKTSIFPSGVVPGHQPTCLPNSICMESTTTEGAPVAEGPPEETNAIGDSRKTTETEARWSLATVYACTIPGWSIPGKIWMPTNQITAVSIGAHVSRELRARAPQASRGI